MELLLAHADDRRPVLEEGLPEESALGAAPPARENIRAADFRYDASDPNILPIQRWGLIAPEGPAGDRLLELVAPLAAARSEDQDGAPIVKFRVPANLDAAGAHAWKNRVYWDESIPEEEVPKYLLILGDLDGASLALQQVLASDTYVGRLACSNDQGYESYVAKVLAREKTAPAPPRALFYTVRDGTSATVIGQRSLMEPVIAGCRARAADRDLVEIEHEAYSPREGLFEEISRPEPAVLFSISHGLGVPKKGWGSFAEQRALQGAMSLGLGGRVAAEDVVSGAFLPGGIWFYLACYGAATPAASAYHRWLGELKSAGHFSGPVDSVLAGLPKSGEPPFVAALPQAALANPDGPLAIISHADLAWTYAFRDMGAAPRDRPSRFAGIFRALLDGARAGVAQHQLLRFYAEASVELATAYESEAKAALRASLWMLRQDLAGYMLLGDPAVRIGPRDTPAMRAPAKSASPAARSERSASVAERELAVLDVIRGQIEPAQIAARCGASVEELHRWVETYRAAGRAALGE